MANNFVKAEKVLFAALGALEREVVLPSLVWRDAGGDFAGARNDKIVLTVPAYTSARRRAMRSAGSRSRDTLHEGQITITLAYNLYKQTPISDEEMTLDIRDFGAQVMAPITNAMVRGHEEVVAELMESATYEHTVAWDADDPHGVLTEAGMDLTRSNVPMSGRAVVLGTRLALEFIQSDQVRRYDSAGDTAQAALRDASIATAFAGFSRVVVSNAIDPNVGYAFHRTAYVLSSRAPVKPEGVPWGASVSAGGFAMRAIRTFDSSADAWQDVLGFDVFVGTDIIKDHGEFDAYGKWVPSDDPDNDSGTDLKFIRAVKITAGASS